MPSTIYFRTGDRVRVALKRQSALYHGEIPNGAEGTVVSLREMKTPFDGVGSTTVAAIVDFPGIGERIVSLTALEFVRSGEALDTQASAARKVLLEALAAYDAAGYPATDAIRGKLVAAAMHLADFKGRSHGDTAEGPEDWFGVL